MVVAVVVAGEGGHGSGAPTYHVPEEGVMPWYAQRVNLPDTHRHYADAGSQHEAVLLRIGYVEVPAPGQTADVLDDPAVILDAPPTEDDVPKPRGKAKP